MWIVLICALYFTIHPKGGLSLAKSNYGTNTQEVPPVCGTVVTKAGEKVILRENVTMSPQEWEKVHIKKLLGARFYPEQELYCLIQVCGFTSREPGKNASCIGSDSDYTDCLEIPREYEAPERIFNAAYNASSISCGCLKTDRDQVTDCPRRAVHLRGTWTSDQCAVLYQRKNCYENYIGPLYLSKGQNYSTDNSHHILSMVVRDGCTVYQTSPALKHMCWFANLTQPIVYPSGPVLDPVTSAFQGDPEYFSCECDAEPSRSSTTSIVTMALVICGMVGVLGVGFTKIWSKRTDDEEPMVIDDNDNISEGSLAAEELGFSNNNSSTSAATADDSLALAEDAEKELVDVPFNPDYRKAREEFEVHGLLNQGNFGKVSKGFMGGKTVAIKTVKYTDCPAEFKNSIRCLQQEIRRHSYLGFHANVVRMLGAFVGDFKNGELFLIIEYCKNGSLEDYLKTISKSTWRTMKAVDGMPPYVYQHEWKLAEDVEPKMLQWLYKWCFQIASGMQYIQLQKVVHIDLATRNVLLTANLTAKVADFGLATKIYINNYVRSNKLVTPLLWLAPECLDEDKYSAESDVWSFGVTVYEIFNFGKAPYANKPYTQVVASIFGGRPLECPQFAPEDVYEILKECWNLDPGQRPSFESLATFFQHKMDQVHIPNTPTGSSNPADDLSPTK